MLLNDSFLLFIFLCIFLQSCFAWMDIDLQSFDQGDNDKKMVKSRATFQLVDFILLIFYGF